MCIERERERDTYIINMQGFASSTCSPSPIPNLANNMS